MCVLEAVLAQSDGELERCISTCLEMGSPTDGAAAPTATAAATASGPAIDADEELAAAMFRSFAEELGSSVPDEVKNDPEYAPALEPRHRAPSAPLRLHARPHGRLDRRLPRPPRPRLPRAPPPRAPPSRGRLRARRRYEAHVREQFEAFAARQAAREGQPSWKPAEEVVRKLGASMTATLKKMSASAKDLASQRGRTKVMAVVTSPLQLGNGRAGMATPLINPAADPAADMRRLEEYSPDGLVDVYSQAGTYDPSAPLSVPRRPSVSSSDGYRM